MNHQLVDFHQTDVWINHWDKPERHLSLDYTDPIVKVTEAHACKYELSEKIAYIVH